MLYNIPCRIYILSTLSLCIMHFWDSFYCNRNFWDSFYCNRNFFRNKNQQRRDARRDHESFGKQPLGKPGDYTGY